jgi:ribonuclease HI
MKKFKMYFDGSCAPINPGGFMGMGYYLEDENGQIIFEGYDNETSNPKNTNNVAEYKALYLGLNEFLNYIGKEKIDSYQLDVYGDSNIVINQMALKWKIKQGNYRLMALKTKELLKYFENINFTWIPREANGYADLLSNKYQTDKLI